MRAYIDTNILVDLVLARQEFTGLFFLSTQRYRDTEVLYFLGFALQKILPLCLCIFVLKNNSYVFRLFHGIAHVEVGRIGILQGQRDETAFSFEGGYLVVVAMLGHVGPCA